MPTNPPVAGLNAKIPLNLCEEENAILEPISPNNSSSSFTLICVGMYTGMRGIPCLSASFKMWVASLEKKDTVNNMILLNNLKQTSERNVALGGSQTLTSHSPGEHPNHLDLKYLKP